MSPEAQRLAIAELCWFRGVHSDGPPDHQLFGLYAWSKPDDSPVPVPDYLNDKGAMFKAKWVCLNTKREWARYQIELRRIVPKGIVQQAHHEARAVLVARGKWEDGK